MKLVNLKFSAKLYNIIYFITDTYDSFGAIFVKFIKLNNQLTTVICICTLSWWLTTHCVNIIESAYLRMKYLFSLLISLFAVNTNIIMVVQLYLTTIALKWNIYYFGKRVLTILYLGTMTRLTLHYLLTKKCWMFALCHFH